MWRVSSVLSLNGLSTPYKFSDDAKERGTAVHAFVEHHAHGETPPVLSDALAERSSLYIAGAEQWFVDFRPVVLFTERRVFSRRLRLTGRIDLGILLGDVVIIVDVKSGGKSPWHGVQVCGYVDLANEDRDLVAVRNLHSAKPWQRGVLYLPGDGTYRWYGPLDLLKVGPHDAYLFRAALALTQWKFDNGYLSVTDAENPD